jgi:hypothetical protein
VVRFEVCANTPAFIDTQISRRTTYYYRVIAVSATSITSPPSNVVTAKVR